MTNAQSFSPELLDQSSQLKTQFKRYHPLKDNVFIIGLVLIALSLGAFNLQPNDGFGGDFFGSFMLHFVLVWAYMITLWLNKRLRWWVFGSKRGAYPTTLLPLGGSTMAKNAPLTKPAGAGSMWVARRVFHW